MKKDAAYAKEIMSTKNGIFLKTDAIAILVRKKGETRNFLKVLDQVTKEGYDLKAQEQLTDLLPMQPHLAMIYILQNKKYVNV